MEPLGNRIGNSPVTRFQWVRQGRYEHDDMGRWGEHSRRHMSLRSLKPWRLPNSILPRVGMIERQVKEDVGSLIGDFFKVLALGVFLLWPAILVAIIFGPSSSSSDAWQPNWWQGTLLFSGQAVWLGILLRNQMVKWRSRHPNQPAKALSSVLDVLAGLSMVGGCIGLVVVGLSQAIAAL